MTKLLEIEFKDELETLIDKYLHAGLMKGMIEDIMHVAIDDMFDCNEDIMHVAIDDVFDCNEYVDGE